MENMSRVEPIKPISYSEIKSSRFLVDIPNYARNIILVTFPNVEVKQEIFEILQDESSISCTLDFNDEKNIQLRIDDLVDDDSIQEFLQIISDYFVDADMQILQDNTRRVERNREITQQVISYLTDLGFNLQTENGVELPKELSVQAPTIYVADNAFNHFKNIFETNIRNQINEIKKEMKIEFIKLNPIDTLIEKANAYHVPLPNDINTLAHNSQFVNSIKGKIMMKNPIGLLLNAINNLIANTINPQTFLQYVQQVKTRLEAEGVSGVRQNGQVTPRNLIHGVVSDFILKFANNSAYLQTPVIDNYFKTSLANTTILTKALEMETTVIDELKEIDIAVQFGKQLNPNAMQDYTFNMYNPDEEVL